MADRTHGFVDVNGITVHYVEQGEGPLVVFCHGFPESWYSWRHQLDAVASAGYRGVALDMRGYGETSQPADLDAYTLSHHIGDVVGTIGALGEETAVIVGHDWGGPVAWYSALMRPDVFRAVAVLSVPFRPATGALPDGLSPTDLMRRAAGGDRDYYRLYFQAPGVADAELDADPRQTVLGFLYTVSGDIISDGVVDACWDGFFPKGQSVMDQLVIPERLPPWLTEEDLDYYAGRFKATGFRGGINWYRNADHIPAILAPFMGTTIEQPAMFMGGEHDLITPGSEWAPVIDAMRNSLGDLRVCELVPGAGHWLQQERADDVNSELVDFLATLA